MSGSPVVQTAGEGAIVALIGYALLAVLSTRLAVLAIKTKRRGARPQSALWSYFTFAGIVGALAGALGLGELVLGGVFRVVDTILLAFVIMIALAMREAYYNATFSNAEIDRLGEFRTRRAIEIGFVVVVVVSAIGQLLGSSGVLTSLVGVTAVVVVGYGIYFHHRRTGEPATRGTLIDSLLRQTLPALVFGGGAVAMSLLRFVGVEPVIVETTANVFVVLTAGALMTVTIKLHQHLLSQY